MKENITNRWIDPGLNKWKHSGAHVVPLTDGHVQIHRVFAPAYHPNYKDLTTAIVVTGQHREEIGAQLAGLTPETFGVLRQYFNLLLYPDVNQTGGNYPEDQLDDYPLRHNPQNFNYNGGWGTVKTPPEVKLVEKDILTLQYQHNLKYKIAASLHQDSTIPQQAIIYTNNVPPVMRRVFTAELVHRWGTSHLAEASSIFTTYQGVVEENFLVVEGIDDYTTYEEWAAYGPLKLPTFTLETPFRAGLTQVELPFAQAAVSSIALACQLCYNP
jgi:hypothetical protein